MADPLKFSDAYIKALKEQAKEEDSLHVNLLVVVIDKLERLENNPMVLVGEFIRSRPTLAISLFGLFLTFIVLWYQAGMPFPNP